MRDRETAYLDSNITPETFRLMAAVQKTMNVKLPRRRLAAMLIEEAANARLRQAKGENNE